MEQIFDHEKLRVYQHSLDFCAWVPTITDSLSSKWRSASSQLQRASQSVPLNIAEGNGKRSKADRNRFLDISRGSALECAAILDVLHVSEAVSGEDARMGKERLRAVVAMLTKLIEANERVSEGGSEYVGALGGECGSE